MKKDDEKNEKSDWMRSLTVSYNGLHCQTGYDHIASSVVRWLPFSSRDWNLQIARSQAAFFILINASLSGQGVRDWSTNLRTVQIYRLAIANH